MVILALKNRSRNNDYNELTDENPTNIELTVIAPAREVPTNSDDLQHSQLGINASSPREHEIETPGGTRTTVMKTIPSMGIKIREIKRQHYSQRYSRVQEGEEENLSIK
jgi:hypothetical protein